MLIEGMKRDGVELEIEKTVDGVHDLLMFKVGPGTCIIASMTTDFGRSNRYGTRPFETIFTAASKVGSTRSKTTSLPHPKS